MIFNFSVSVSFIIFNDSFLFFLSSSSFIFFWRSFGLIIEFLLYFSCSWCELWKSDCLFLSQVNFIFKCCIYIFFLFLNLLKVSIVINYWLSIVTISKAEVSISSLCLLSDKLLVLKKSRFFFWTLVISFNYSFSSNKFRIFTSLFFIISLKI